MLVRDYGWVWYGGHHLENRYTSFWHQYFLPNRTSTDLRQIGTAALVRSGQLAREKGLALLQEAVNCPDVMMELAQKRLNFTDEQFAKVMKQAVTTFSSFPHYTGSFERISPFVAIYVTKG